MKETNNFSKNLDRYLGARRKHRINWLGKIRLFGKKKDEADIPEETVKKLLQSKTHEFNKPNANSDDADGEKENATTSKKLSGTVAASLQKIQSSKKIEYSPEELNLLKERNKDAAEIMNALEGALALLSEDEKSRFQKTENFEEFKKKLMG